MKYLLLLIPILLSSCTTQEKTKAKSSAPLFFSIVQGHTTDSSTQINILLPKFLAVHYFVRGERADNKLELRDISVEHYEREDSEWAVEKLYIRGLSLGYQYTLEVRGAYNELLQTREFKTLNIEKDTVRFAVASCMDDGYPIQKKIWTELLAKNPEVIFLIGDSVYANRNTSLSDEKLPGYIWKRHVEARLLYELYRSQKLTPVFSIWDDGEYGKKDGDRNFSKKDDAAEIFNIFFSQEEDFKNLEAGPGVSFRLNGFQQNFYFMDDRSYRSPNNEELEDETHWGAAQEKWFFDGVKATEQPVWLINGDQFYGGYHKFESYEGSHPRSFRKFIKTLSKVKTPILFLTGDRHLTEVMKIVDKKDNFSTFELTTSGLHAKLYPSTWGKQPNPLQIEGRTELLNYFIIESDNNNGTLNARLTAYSLNNEVLFYRFFRVKPGVGTDRIFTR